MNVAKIGKIAIAENVLFGALLFLWVPSLVAAGMMFDDSGSQDNIINWILFWSIIAYGPVTLMSIVVSGKRRKRGDITKSFYWSSLPILIFIVGFSAVLLLDAYCDGKFSCRYCHGVFSCKGEITP